MSFNIIKYTLLFIILMIYISILFLFLKESSLSVDMATTQKPHDLSITITKIMHHHVTYKSNTSTIGKNIFIFHV